MNERPIYVTAEEVERLLNILMWEGPEDQLWTFANKVRKVNNDFIEADRVIKQVHKRSMCNHQDYEPLIEGDCPAGNWWHVCSGCGAKI